MTAAPTATCFAMLRRTLLLGAAVCGIAHAAAAPRLELTLSAPWKGWSRPGRTTEVDVRVTERIEVRAVTPGAAAVQREIDIAPSESPLLGLALAGGEVVDLAGFHAVALAADDLPRHAPAYASIDALVVDAATLRQLDQRQLAALLAHAAGCGRIVVVGADAPLRRLLDGMGGCGGRALMAAGSLAETRALLERSLADSLPAPIDAAAIGAPARPSPLLWRQVAVAVAACLAAIALAIVFASSLSALLATSALATVAVVGWLHAIDPPSQLVVWSDGDAGARVARYQAWHLALKRIERRSAILAGLIQGSTANNLVTL